MIAVFVTFKYGNDFEVAKVQPEIAQAAASQVSGNAEPASEDIHREARDA